MKTNDIKEVAEFFLNKITLVHIKTTYAFYNGYIKEIHSNKIIFDDKLFGEIPLPLSEIIKIEPYKVEKK